MVFLNNFMKKDKWTPPPKTIKCEEAKKRNLCETCFYFFICYPSKAPDKEYTSLYYYDD